MASPMVEELMRSFEAHIAELTGKSFFSRMHKFNVPLEHATSLKTLPTLITAKSKSLVVIIGNVSSEGVFGKNYFITSVALVFRRLTDVPVGVVVL